MYKYIDVKGVEVPQFCNKHIYLLYHTTRKMRVDFFFFLPCDINKNELNFILRFETCPNPNQLYTTSFHFSPFFFLYSFIFKQKKEVEEKKNNPLIPPEQFFFSFFFYSAIFPIFCCCFCCLSSISFSKPNTHSTHIFPALYYVYLLP